MKYEHVTLKVGKHDYADVPLQVALYDDGDYALRFGEFAHCYQVYMNERSWRSLIGAMQRMLPVDPDEETRYYGDSELDPNPREES